jgi:ribonucleoside-diphosphate reductase alpha chain
MVTGHPNIKMANSVIDLIFRTLGYEYLGREDLVQVVAPKVDTTGEADDLGRDADRAPDDKIAQVAEYLANHPPFVTLQDVVTAATRKPDAAPVPVNDQQVHLAAMGGDAPFCDACGHITVRNGSCYKCLNCGNSLGCS